MSLLARASLRFLARHRAQCLLAILGIALGIALVVAMQLIQASARDAFAASLAGVFGRATHHLVARDGALAETELARIRRLLPEARPSPVVAGHVRLAGTTADLHVVGIDVFSAQGGRAAGFDVRALVLTRGGVVLNATTAARHGLARGARVPVMAAGRAHELTVLTVLPARPDGGSAELPDDVLLADIATAQELFDSAGRLSRIELESDDAAAMRRLAETLPPGLELSAVGRRLRSTAALTRAFYTNLDALSLLALLVGGFMVHNTMSFLVVQRQPLFARLRALGATPGEIGRAIAGEALLLGFIGGALGCAFGVLLARRLLAPVTQTLRDHYFESAAGTVGVTPAWVAGTLALAMGVSLIAAWWPARAAAHAEPAAAANPSWRQHEARRLLARAAVLGAGCALVGALLLAGSTRSLAAGFAALAGIMVGAMLATPWLTERALCVAASAVPVRWLAARLALRSAARALGRIGLAVSALMAATATSIGVGLMVESFRDAVGDWLGQLLRADVYVMQSAEGGATIALDPALVAALEALPGAAAVSLVKRSIVDSARGPLRVAAYRLPPRARAGFRIVGEALPADFWTRWDSADLALVSAPLAWHWGLARGDRVHLVSAGERIAFTVAGIYDDYGSEHGVLAMSLTRYRHHWPQADATGAGVYAAPGVSASALLRAVSAALPADGRFAAWSNAALAARSIEVFDRTFAVTDVLTLVATAIAALGVFNALLALHLERAREYAMLLALGCGPARLRLVLYTQSAVIAALAVAAALPLGWIIARLLVDVINLRSFGWHMPLAWHDDALAVPAVTAMLAAMAATVYPAERASRVDPAQALRHE